MSDFSGTTLTARLGGRDPEAKAKRRQAVRRFCKNPGLVLGAAFLGVVILAALLAPLLAPYSTGATDLLHRMAKPVFLAGGDWRHILGTDSLGRDQLTRILYGARISLLVGATAVVGAGAVGILLGAIAGFFGGWVDEIIMRVVDIGLAIPFVLLAMTTSMLLGSGLFNVILVLSLTGWMQFARVTRGSALKVREETYIEAARAYGCRPARTIRKHLIPNLLAPLLVIGSQQIGVMIYAEATLSFLGFGVPVATPTWGRMIADGQNYVATAWWVSTTPGIVLTLTVVAAFLLGDGLRDYLDPKLKD